MKIQSVSLYTASYSEIRNESSICTDGFYEDNGVCQLSCLTFKGVNDGTANAITVIYYIAFSCSLIVCIFFIVAVVVQRQTVYVNSNYSCTNYALIIISIVPSNII